MEHAWGRLDALVDWSLRWAHLPGDLVGVTDWASRTITVDARLTQAELHCTLLHEVVHAERGPFPRWAEAREEAAVDDVVARALIPLEQLVAAVSWSRCPWELAEELWVDVPTLAARARGLTPAERQALDRHFARAE